MFLDVLDVLDESLMFGSAGGGKLQWCSKACFVLHVVTRKRHPAAPAAEWLQPAASVT